MSTGVWASVEDAAKGLGQTREIGTDRLQSLPCCSKEGPPVKHRFSIKRVVHVEQCGKCTTETISIGGIERKKSGSYSCYYHLPVLSPKRRRIHGEDAVQALMLCLDFVGGLLKIEMESRDVKIWWVERGDAGGFRDHIRFDKNEK